MSTGYLNYVTLAGLDEEAQAKEEGRKVAITQVVIGLGLLPDNEQPQNQTALLEPKAETTCFVKAIDTEHGFYRIEADIPIPDTGYNYFEMGTLTDTGVLYSYARSRGDYIAGTADSDGKLTRIRLNFRTDNSELITITQDDSILFTPITDFEAHVVEFNAHCQADNPHPQYVLDAHAATNDDIDNVSNANKFIKLQQLWRALAPIRDRANEALSAAHSKWSYVVASTTTYGATKLSSATNSTSESLAATAGALKKVADIAASKMTKSEADGHYVAKSQVSSSTTSTSVTNVANSKGLKDAMDRANAAYNKASGTVTFTSGSNANGWWRKWSDGRIEQWGRYPGKKPTNTKVYFPIAFTNASTIIVTGDMQSKADGYGRYPNGTITTTYWEIYRGDLAYHWYATGY